MVRGAAHSSRVPFLFQHKNNCLGRFLAVDDLPYGIRCVPVPPQYILSGECASSDTLQGFAARLPAEIGMVENAGFADTPN